MTGAHQPRRAGLGFSLIELVAVLAIFALVAVMALQALTGAIFQRQVLERVDAEAEGLTRALVLMRRDFQAAVPIVFRPPLAEAEPALLAPEGAGRVAISIGGHPRLSGATGAGLARVIWRYDPVAETLTRQVWPVLDPARGDLVEPERIMLNGVTGLVLAPLGAWPGRADDPSSLPQGFDLTVTTTRHGALRLVIAR